MGAAEQMQLASLRHLLHLGWLPTYRPMDDVNLSRVLNSAGDRARELTP